MAISDADVDAAACVAALLVLELAESPMALVARTR